MTEESTYWQRAQRTRITRRRMLYGTAAGAAGLAAAALVGCGDDAASPGPGTSPGGPAATGPAASGTPSGASVAAPPQYSSLPAQKLIQDYHWSKVQPQTQVLGTPRMGGVLSLQVWGLGTDSLHPEGTSPSGQPFAAPLLLSNLIMPDWRANPDMTPATARYAVSESWENPDASTFIFKLRPNVTFHNVAPVNGAKLTVDDVRETYDWYKTKSRFHALNFKTIASITEPSPGVVRLTTSEPSVHMLGTLRNSTYGVLNAKHIQGGDDALKAAAIGTGPFMQAKFAPPQVRVYKRNPTYWWKDEMGNQQPYMDGVVHKVIADPAAALAAFRTGQTDYYRPTTLDEWERLRKDLDAWGVAFVRTTGLNSYLAMSQRDPLFRDLRVRKALAMSINHQELIDSVFNGAASTADWIPWYFRGLQWPEPLDKMGPNYKFDPQGARNLLKEAGIAPGTKIDLTFQGQLGAGGGGSGMATGDAYIEPLRKYFKDVGIELNLKAVNQTEWRTTFYGAKWNGMINSTGGHGVHAVEADNWVQTAVTGAGINAVGISDTKVDELWRKERATINFQDRAKVLQDLEQYVNRDNLLFGVQLPTSFSYSLWRKYLRNTIEGPTWAMNGGLMVHEVEWWLDDRVEKRNLDSY